MGLAVGNGGVGVAIEIECLVEPARSKGAGALEVGGAVEYEELELQGRRLGRKGTARTSAENVLGAFQKNLGWDANAYDVRFNIPGGLPMDGPSAGIALAVALMGAISGKAPIPKLALTGEITVQGEVRPVGGVAEKLDAAIQGGAHTVLIPKANWEEAYASLPCDVIPRGGHSPDPAAGL